MVEITIHRDKLLKSIGRYKSEEAARASEVGEMREDIKSLLELTGVNKKAFSWIRALDKMEPEKREDVLRSFDAMRDEIMQPEWDGQKTPDMFQEPVEPAPAAPSYESNWTPGDPEVAAESDDFDKHLAQVAAQ